MEQIPVSTIMGKYLIRYQRLSQLVPYAFKGSKATKINLFIDLYGLYYTMISRSYRTDISDYTALTRSVVNMCSHYREFFKGLGVYPSIWIISSYNIPEINCKFVAGYNKIMKDKIEINPPTVEMVDLNCQLLDVLCPYLPDIYFVKTKFESTVVMDHIIKYESINENNNPNVILSSDIYPIQLCNKYNNTVQLYPVKYMGNDDSNIVCPKGHPDQFSSFFGVITRRRDKLASNMNEVMISPANYVLLQACTRFPERGLLSLLPFSDGNRYIANVVQGQDISISVDMLFNCNPGLDTKISKEMVDSRFKALDVNYQSLLYENDQESKLLHYENLSDPEALNMINNQYFSKEPLDLMRL